VLESGVWRLESAVWSLESKVLECWRHCTNGDKPDCIRAQEPSISSRCCHCPAPTLSAWLFVYCGLVLRPYSTGLEC
jgi:hypothetical protein